MQRDVTYAKPVIQYPPDNLAGTTPANGSAVDCRGFRNALIIVSNGDVGSGSAGTASVAVKVQDSPDNSVWTDITDATFTALETGNANSIQIGFVNLQNAARYLRCVSTGSTALGAEHSSAIVLFEHNDSGRQDVSYEFSV